MSNEWENITSGKHPTPETFRLKVPGGWIYWLYPMYDQPSSVFVPHVDLTATGPV